MKTQAITRFFFIALTILGISLPSLGADQPLTEPEFPGGQEALRRFMERNLIYPEAAKDKGVEGKVLLRFLVMEDGLIRDIEVEKSLDPQCDEEAMNMVASMPNWMPAREKGKRVAKTVHLWVQFRLP